MDKEKLDEIAEVFTNQYRGRIVYSFEEEGFFDGPALALVARVPGLPPLAVASTDPFNGKSVTQARESLDRRVFTYLLEANAERHEKTTE